MVTKNFFSEFRRVTILTLIFLRPSLSSSRGSTPIQIDKYSNKNRILKTEQQYPKELKKKNSSFRQQRKLRFALVDVGVSFWFPSSTRNGSTNNKTGIFSPPLKTIETACRHFLIRELSVNPITKIFDVRVRVVSQEQTIENSSDIRQYSTSDSAKNDNGLITAAATTTTAATTSTTIMDVSNANAISAHVITTYLEVAVQYELSEEITELNDMNGRIRVLFSTQRKNLLDLLVFLDEDYFGGVFAIGLESSKSTLTSSTSSSDQSVSINSPDDTDIKLSLSLYFIIGLVAIGMGMILLLILLPKILPPSIPRERDSNRSRRRMVKDLKMQHVHGNTMTDVKDLRTVESPNKLRMKTSFSKQRQKNVMMASIVSTKEDSNEASREMINHVFLKDKLQCPLGFEEKTFVQQSRQDKSEADNNLTENLRRIQTTRSKKRKQEIEFQILALRNKRKLIENQIDEKYETLVELTHQTTLACWRVHDDISALSCEIINTVEDGEEDQELKILSIEDGRNNQQQQKNGCRKERKPAYLSPYHEKEYY